MIDTNLQNIKKEMLILVNDKDEDIGSASKKECHEGSGLLHRAFSVFIFNQRKEVLIQQRSDEKMLWGKYWSNACCSHPRLGEEIEKAAHRRIKEELSLECDLSYLFKFQYQKKFLDVGSEFELCHVFIGKNDHQPSADPSEIKDWKYISIDELTQSMNKNPEYFTPWLQIEWSKIIGSYSEQVEDILGFQLKN